VDDFLENGGGARSILPPALCHPPLGNDEHEEEEDDQDQDQEEDEEEHLVDASGDMKGEDNEEEEEEEGSSKDASKGSAEEKISNKKSSELMIDEWVEDDDGSSEQSEDGDDAPTSGIIVSMDDFEGPSGWTSTKPHDGKLVKNPLASLMPMSDITNNVNHNQNQSATVTTKQYILNVNFAGNEMMESHIRVILETSDADAMQAMDWYLQCEARGETSAGRIFDNNSDEKHGIPKLSDPPPALFYYGYFSWRGPSLSEADARIMSIINARKCWPPMQKRVMLFDSDELTRVRLFESARFSHERVASEGKACTLCSINTHAKRRTVTICSVCKIPLCTKPIGDGTETCFKLWHTCEDLSAAHRKLGEALKKRREESRAAGKYEHARSVRRLQLQESPNLAANGEEAEEKEMDDEQMGGENTTQESKAAGKAEQTPSEGEDILEVNIEMKQEDYDRAAAELDIV